MKSFFVAITVAMSAVAAQASTVQLQLDADGWTAADDPIKESQTAIFESGEGGVVIGHDPNRTDRSLNQNLAVVKHRCAQWPVHLFGVYDGAGR